MNFCKEKRIIKEPLKKIGIILQIKSVNMLKKLIELYLDDLERKCRKKVVQFLQILNFVFENLNGSPIFTILHNVENAMWIFC